MPRCSADPMENPDAMRVEIGYDPNREPIRLSKIQRMQREIMKHVAA